MLQYAQDEADRLLHNYIGTEHLLLGVLREECSAAATLLQQHHLGLAAARERVESLAQGRDAAHEVDASARSLPPVFADRDVRPYAIKRTQRPALASAETVEIVVGKYAAFARVMQHDARLSDAEREQGWEYFFEPARATGAPA